MTVGHVPLLIPLVDHMQFWIHRNYIPRCVRPCDNERPVSLFRSRDTTWDAPPAMSAEIKHIVSFTYSKRMVVCLSWLITKYRKPSTGEKGLENLSGCDKANRNSAGRLHVRRLVNMVRLVQNAHYQPGEREKQDNSSRVHSGMRSDLMFTGCRVVQSSGLSEKLTVSAKLTR